MGIQFKFEAQSIRIAAVGKKMPQQPAPRKVIKITPVVDPDAKVYPRSISGPFTRWRWIFVWLTQIVFYGLCWVPWHGRQAILFDLETRKFYFFDLVLWPQDTIYLVLLMVLGALALFLFTAVAGRLWCGYACPQTVYTEIFLWFEKLIEGERPQRIKLDAAPWSLRKLATKTAKHAIWLLFSLWTGFTFVGYFTPIRDLAQDLVTFSAGAWSSFWVVFYGFATYGNAGFLRDQMCRQICPYARFQFVMFDPDTLIIAYDVERGESRGARARGIDPRTQGLGDCVDCSICVQVCPTGIDIRDGLQYECIGCSACIDACDQVMDKMGYRKGLIRYTTQNALRKHWGSREIIAHLVRPRTLVYAGVLSVIIGAAAIGIALRVPLKVNVIRDRATLAREVEGGLIENVYRLQLINTSERPRRISVAVTGLPGIALANTARAEIPAETTQSLSVRVRAATDAGKPGAHPIRFEVRTLEGDELVVREKATFLLP